MDEMRQLELANGLLYGRIDELRPTRTWTFGALINDCRRSYAYGRYKHRGVSNNTCIIAECERHVHRCWIVEVQSGPAEPEPNGEGMKG